MPRSRRGRQAKKATERLKSDMLEMLPDVLKFVDQPTLVLSVRQTNSEWASRVPPLHTLALRTAVTTNVGIARTEKARTMALQSLVRVYCSAQCCSRLRAIDITAVQDNWGGNWPWTDAENCLKPLLCCSNLESIALPVNNAELLPELVQRPQTRFVRLQGTGYGDIGGDSELSDALCVAIATSRLRALHLRYAAWTRKKLVLPPTLRELVVESYPWDDNFGCDTDDFPGDVVVGQAQLRLLALSMSCTARQPADMHGNAEILQERPHFFHRMGCWDTALLRSFRDCGSLSRVILPRDALCITDTAVKALEHELTAASQREAWYSWMVIGMHLRRTDLCMCSETVAPEDSACLNFARLPQRIMKSVLEFTITGPVVECPAVWPDCMAGNTDNEVWTGFPTLAAYCSAAADLHAHNAFNVGESDKIKDDLWQASKAREWMNLQRELQQPQEQKQRRANHQSTRRRKRKHNKAEVRQ